MRFALRTLLSAIFLLQLGPGIALAQDQLEEAEKLREEAQALFRQENWPKFIETYLKAFEASPGTSQEYRLVASVMLREDRADEAVLLLKEGEKEHPDSLPIQVDLAMAYNATEQFDLALKLFERLEIRVGQTNPNLINDAFYFSYGAAAERLKKFDLADECFRKSIERVPLTAPERAAMPMNYLGYMWLEQDRNLDEAGVMIVKANNLIPDSGAYADSLGWWQFKKKNFKAALSELERAAKLMADEEQEDAVVYDHLAQAHFALGQKAKAIENLEKAVKLDPENAEFSGRLEEYKAD